MKNNLQLKERICDICRVLSAIFIVAEFIYMVVMMFIPKTVPIICGYGVVGMLMFTSLMMVAMLDDDVDY